MADLDDLRGALTPGTTVAGETLKLDITSPRDLDGLTVTLFEVDVGGGDEPKGADSLVGRFRGNVADGAFVLVPPKKGSNPEKNPKPGKDAPKIKVKVGATAHELDLPGGGARGEMGVFELALVLSAKGHKTYRYPDDGKSFVFVRQFQFYKAKEKRRPVVTFLTDKDLFLKVAGMYWDKHADAVFNRPGIGIEGIFTALRKLRSKFGDWGEVNIVNHGNLIPMFVRLFDKKDDKFLDAHKIDEAFAPESKKDLSNLKAAGLDAESRVVFRACNAGNNPKLLDAFHKRLLEEACAFFIPKELQGYFARGSDERIEFFAEALSFFHKGKAAPSAKLVEATLKAQFEAKFPGASWDDEKKTFDTKEIPQHPDTPQNMSRFVLVREEKLFKDLTTGAKNSDKELIPILEQDWKDKKVEEDDRFWLTQPSDWEITVIKKHDKGDFTDGYWFESSIAGKGAAVPKFLLQTTTGKVSIGSSGSSTIQLPAKGVASTHLMVDVLSFGQMEGGAFDLKITNVSSGTVTGTAGTSSVVLKPGNFVTVTGFAKLKMGSATITIRFPKRIDIQFGLHRHFIQRRRKMRVFDASIPFEKRDLVVPDLNNPNHYGSRKPKAAPSKPTPPKKKGT